MATSTTFASPSRLETLPLPLLESICEYLAHCGSKRRSLFTFSLASKFCCLVSTRERFNQLTLTLCHKSKLHQDMKRWEEILGTNERIRYVRRVKLLGSMSPLQDHRPAGSTSALPSGMVSGMDEEESETDKHEGEEDHFFTPSKDFFADRSFGDAHRWDWHVLPNKEEARNKELLPLARLLEQIPNLQDVVYACTHRIPTCILTALHQYHPNTRLHLHTFNLDQFPNRRYESVLGRFRNDDLDIVPNKYISLLSPYLYSIIVLYSEHNCNRTVDYSEEIALQKMQMAAPRLRHVRILQYPLPSSHEYIHRPPMALGMWHNGVANDAVPSPTLARSKKHAHNLVLDMLGFRDGQPDFYPLHSLEIQNNVNVDVIQKLTRLSKKGGLRSIHTLALWIAYIDVTEPSIDEAASLLLQLVPPLKDLRLIGPVANCTFTAILLRHGETLRKLQFIPACERSMHDPSHFINHLDIHKISKWCPNLEQIELRTRRTGGDEEEMSVYRALSTLPRLKQVKLHLYCSPLMRGLQNFTRRPFDDRSVELRIRESLVNSAIDSSLAESIFLAIFPAANTTTTTTTTTTNQQLQTLELQPLVDGRIDQSTRSDNFYCILYWIARSWAVSARRRASSDTSNGTGTEIRVKEIKKRLTPLLMPDLEDYYFGSIYKRAWMELWPPAKGDKRKEWWKNWWSFPLYSEWIRDGDWDGDGDGEISG